LSKYECRMTGNLAGSIKIGGRAGRLGLGRGRGMLSATARPTHTDSPATASTDQTAAPLKLPEFFIFPQCLREVHNVSVLGYNNTGRLVKLSRRTFLINFFSSLLVHPDDRKRNKILKTVQQQNQGDLKAKESTHPRVQLKLFPETAAPRAVSCL